MAVSDGCFNDSYHDLFAFRAGRDKRLAGIVGLIFLEVLDEAGSQVFCLDIPGMSELIGITRIQDLGINAFQFNWYFKVEVRDRLGFTPIDGTV